MLQQCILHLCRGCVCICSCRYQIAGAFLLLLLPSLNHFSPIPWLPCARALTLCVSTVMVWLFLPIGQYAHGGALIGQGHFFFLFINFLLPEDHFHAEFMFICLKIISFGIYNICLKITIFAIFAYTRVILRSNLGYFSHGGGAPIFFALCSPHIKLPETRIQ